MPYLLLLLALTVLTVLGGCDREPQAQAATPTASPTENQPQRPDFTLADIDGKSHNVSEWDGKVLVVNFWATWCPPCRKEMPEFIALQKEYGPRGLQFVGLALDDADRVRKFAATMGVNYPLLVGDDPVYEAASAYGNKAGVLPYTAIVDRQGRVIYTHAGELSREEAESVILPLL